MSGRPFDAAAPIVVERFDSCGAGSAVGVSTGSSRCRALSMLDGLRRHLGSDVHESSGRAGCRNRRCVAAVSASPLSVGPLRLREPIFSEMRQGACCSFGIAARSRITSG